MINIATGTVIRVPVEGHLFDVLCNAGALVPVCTEFARNSETGYVRYHPGTRIPVATWVQYGTPVEDADGTEWIECTIADLAAADAARWSIAA